MSTESTKGSFGIMASLSTMMFLQFFIWGAWFVTLGTYLGKGLGFSGVDIGRTYGTMPWGAIIAPFFVGMIADRFFSAEKVLAICHLLGAGLLYYASTITSLGTLFIVLLAYAICYNPTLALVNAISFNQMTDTKKQFPYIRVFGTVGWIVAGIIVGCMKVEDTSIPMKIAAGCSLLLGIYAFFLPKNPPKSLGHKVTVSDVLGLEALRLMKKRSFAVFVVGSLLITIPLAFYYSFCNLFLNEVGIVNAAGKMTMGQMSETIFMLLIPFFFARLGVKKMLIVGMLAWVGRYLLFAFGSPDSTVWMYYIGIALHGICYDFFFVTGQIYVDNTAPNAIQASAQGFIALITYGVGMLIGNEVAGQVVKKYVTDGGHDWKTIWLIPAVMAFIIIVIFAILFKDEKGNEEIEEEPAPEGEPAPEQA